MTDFEITWDYRCPFARNAHEHVLAALAADAPWAVRFRPFSLDQTHVPEDEPPVWERPEEFPGLTANLAGIAVRDRFPDAFPAVHLDLFAARHDDARDIRDRAVVADVLARHVDDVEVVMAAIDDGTALAALADEHQRAVKDHSVFGVPTFIVGDQAAFVRLMSRPEGDDGAARRTIERVLGEIEGFAELNELKHTTIPR